MNVKRGDIVARKSYGKDILFSVEKVIRTKNKMGFAILKGLDFRIVADSPIEDLILIDEIEVKKRRNSFENRLKRRIST